MILISGDTHWPKDIEKLQDNKIANEFSRLPDYLLIAGDFGLIWMPSPSGNEQAWVKELDSKPYETLVVLGNHENFERIYQLPMVDKFGAKVYKYSKKVFILQHGNIYNIEGKNFFVFGGALSIDKHLRQEGISWWKEEIPSYADFKRASLALEENKDKIDYVITHTFPTSIVEKINDLTSFSLSNLKDPTCFMLDALKEIILDFETLPKTWFGGHFHFDQEFEEKGVNYQVLFNNLFLID